GFYYPMTPPVKEAVDVVYSRLAGWVGNGGFQPLTPALTPEGRG
ncbi:hydrogenase maturation peptidase HycI, partial [Enterobacter hormaechei]|nr:hydrogenase maturation peptidase HycI [Enterobacter hormaechei]